MRHLTPDEFVDCLEGTRDTTSHPHLASCAACRRELDDLRAAMTTAADAPVPEPSPLFWNHFSDRVSAAIEQQGAPRFAWWTRLVVPATALLAAAAIILIVRAVPSRPQPSATPSAHVNGDAPVRDVLPDIDDSLTLVADLTASFDIDAAREAGLTSRGDAEHAVTHLEDGELRELRRLIQQEMVHQ